MKNCPECNSLNIIKDAKPVDQGDGSELKIVVDEQPDALIMKKRSYSAVKCEVCAECGFIAFYAIDATMLRAAYQKRQNKI